MAAAGDEVHDGRDDWRALCDSFAELWGKGEDTAAAARAASYIIE